jgi:hypothetical protein
VTDWSTSGQSAAGSNVSTTTPSGLPGPVQNLSLIAETITTLTLSWKLPPGPLVNATLYYRSGSCVQSAPFGGVSLGLVTTTTLTNLPGGTTFAVIVAAWNATGQGTLSDCLTVTTDPLDVGAFFQASSQLLSWPLITLTIAVVVIGTVVFTLAIAGRRRRRGRTG